jgi:hypothetical protein
VLLEPRLKSSLTLSPPLSVKSHGTLTSRRNEREPAKENKRTSYEELPHCFVGM